MATLPHETQLLLVHYYTTSFSRDVVPRRSVLLAALLTHKATSVEIRLPMGATGKGHGVIRLAVVWNGNSVIFPCVEMVSLFIVLLHTATIRKHLVAKNRTVKLS